MKYAIVCISNLILLFYLLKKDRLEKEPVHLILLCLFLGALSCIPAGLLEEVLEYFLPTNVGDLTFSVLDNFLVTALVEEGVKFLVIMLFIYKNKNFDFKFDGIVYACCVAIGFSLLEDIGYVLEEGMAIAWLRVLTDLPGHFLFAIFMGYFLSKSKEKNKLYLLFALLIPVLIHGAYDFLVDYMLLWIGFIIISTIIGLLLLNNISKTDYELYNSH